MPTEQIRHDGDASAESLVPMIEEEEQRLEITVEEARNEAKEIIASAERHVREAIAELKGRLPSLQEEKKKAAMAVFEKEAEELRREASDAIAGFRKTVVSARKAAVKKVVESVWPVER